jgi:hypothetical protein
MDTKHVTTPAKLVARSSLREGNATDGTRVPQSTGMDRKDPVSPAKAESSKKRKTMSQKESCEQNLKDCAAVLEEAYKLYGFVGKSEKSTVRTVRHWMTLAEPMNFDWMKLMKYKLAAFYAYHIGNEQPTMPWPASSGLKDSSKKLLLGKWDRFAQGILHHKVAKNPEGFTPEGMRKLSFITTLLYSKKGMPRPSQDAIDKACKEMKQALTTKKALPKQASGRYILKSRVTFSEIGEWEEGKDPTSVGNMRMLNEVDLVDSDYMRSAIKRVVREVFRNVTYTNEDRQMLVMPSLNANYNRSRGKGGALGEVLAEENKDLFDGLRCERNQRLVYMEEDKAAFPAVLREPRDVTGIAAVNLRDQDVDEERKIWNVEESVSSRFAIYYSRLVNKALEERAIVEPVGLAEALKVRVISKGPPLTYTALKPLQRKMHATLRRHKLFRLIGEPVTAEMIQQEIPFSQGKAYLSGDYSAATDKLAPWAAETAANEIADVLELSNDERELFIKALTAHQFLDDDGNMVPQRWGQLMGSIVSFPILCIINAAVLLVHTEVCRGLLSRERMLRLRDCKGFINGDDLLTQVRELKAARVAWEVIASLVGFDPSLGKYYWHPTVMNVNSTNFVSTSSGVQKVQYVNLGLLFGLKRSGGSRSVLEQDAYVDIGSAATELVKTCPDPIRLRVYAKFIEINKSRLSIKSKKGGEVKVPWYIPKWLGGLGLPMCWETPDGQALIESELLAGKRAFEQWRERTLVNMEAKAVPWTEQFREFTRNSNWTIYKTLEGSIAFAEMDGPHLPSELDRKLALQILLQGKQVAKLPPTASWAIWEKVKAKLPNVTRVTRPTAFEEEQWGKLVSVLVWETILQTTDVKQLEDAGKETMAFRVFTQNSRLYDPRRNRIQSSYRFDWMKILEPKEWDDITLVSQFQHVPAIFAFGRDDDQDQ